MLLELSYNVIYQQEGAFPWHMLLRSCAHVADIKAVAGFSHRYEEELVYDQARQINLPAEYPRSLSA